jgi:hypothetical protein
VGVVRSSRVDQTRRPRRSGPRSSQLMSRTDRSLRPERRRSSPAHEDVVTFARLRCSTRCCRTFRSLGSLRLCIRPSFANTSWTAFFHPLPQRTFGPQSSPEAETGQGRAPRKPGSRLVLDYAHPSRSWAEPGMPRRRLRQGIRRAISHERHSSGAGASPLASLRAAGVLPRGRPPPLWSEVFGPRAVVAPCPPKQRVS